MVDDKKKIKILWLSPNLNHYKIGLLNQLTNDIQIDLTVLFGSVQKNIARDSFAFKTIETEVAKKKFGNSKQVKNKLRSVLNDFDWVMLPVEKKNALLFLYVRRLSMNNSNVRLFSYNHPVIRSGNGKVTYLDKWLTKFFYNRLDRVVFYTEQSCAFAIENKLLERSKAFWANNTIDASEIEKINMDRSPAIGSDLIVYIGKLAKRKRIPDLIRYYQRLKQDRPNLRLEVIGDGAERELIQKLEKSDKNVVWHGVLTKQQEISPILNRAAFVFVPGHSGLSINHAFLYGKPYVTLVSPSHPPEIEYVDHGKNGFVLDNDFESNINTLNRFLSNEDTLKSFSENARRMGKYLSAKNWVQQMKRALIDEA